MQFITTLTSPNAWKGRFSYQLPFRFCYLSKILVGPFFIIRFFRFLLLKWEKIVQSEKLFKSNREITKNISQTSSKGERKFSPKFSHVISNDLCGICARGQEKFLNPFCTKIEIKLIIMGWRRGAHKNLWEKSNDIWNLCQFWTLNQQQIHLISV